MNDDQFRALVRTICNDQTPRVWSLLVSVFGELGQDPASKISGALLNKLADLMGVKPEATRVALHRLRKEGWIESERAGRKSNYFLSGLGRRESSEATPLIYGAAKPADTAWFAMFDTSPPPDAVTTNCIWLSSLTLLSLHEPKVQDALILKITAETPIPHWVSGKLIDEATIGYTRTLAQNLAKVERTLDRGRSMGQLQIAALRILIIHAWRRVVLRTPNLSARFFPDDWAGAHCKDTVTGLLARLPEQSLGHLEQVIANRATPRKAG